MEMTLSIVGLTNMDIPTLGTNLKWALNYQAILMKKWNWLMTPVVLSVVLFIACTGCRSASVNISIRGHGFRE